MALFRLQVVLERSSVQFLLSHAPQCFVHYASKCFALGSAFPSFDRYDQEDRDEEDHDAEGEDDEAHQGSRACAHFHLLIDMTKKTATKKTTTPKAKTTKATLKKITAVKRAAGKKAKKVAGKARALAMKKKGVGIFAPKVLSPALATICGGKKMPRTEVTKKIWAYIKKNKLNDGRTIKPDSTLKAVFPVASIDMLKMAGYVSKHLS